MPTLPDLSYPMRSEKLISPATISDFVRQRIRDNPAQVVKLLIELDDCRALLQTLATLPDNDRTAAIAFHDFLENDEPFDQNTDE
jgi:hypothetical protein